MSRDSHYEGVTLAVRKTYLNAASTLHQKGCGKQSLSIYKAKQELCREYHAS
jgi:hypothetical protein